MKTALLSMQTVANRLGIKNYGQTSWFLGIPRKKRLPRVMKDGKEFVKEKDFHLVKSCFNKIKSKIQFADGYISTWKINSFTYPKKYYEAEIANHLGIKSYNDWNDFVEASFDLGRLMKDGDSFVDRNLENKTPYRIIAKWKMLTKQNNSA